MSELIREQLWLHDFNVPVKTGIILVLSLAIVVPVCTIIADYVRVLLLRRRLPPGPFPLPLFGNYFQITKVKPWIEWENWARKNNNPMLTVWSGHRPVIICNDAWTISDLCERRANIYSSRPYMPAMGDLTLSSSYNQTALPYGDQWRMQRKLIHTAVGSQAIRKYQAFQSDEGKVLARDLLNKPNDFVSSIERYAVSVVSIIGWGRRIDTANDIVAQVALQIMEGVDLVIPCWHIVDVLPWLLKAPAWLYSIPTQMAKASMIGMRWFFDLCEEASERQDNFAKFLVQDREANGLSKEEVGAITGNLIGGGVDTTTGSILSFILAMCAFPEVQEKAHEELDRVIGQERSPTVEDEQNLPYILALVQEVLRWRTVTILGGIPHAPIQDDTYRGYFIPKGTPIHGNVWAIHRHPREYPAHDTFRPERFLNGLERPYPNNKGHNAFGWGRRQCSGQPLAEQGLRMTIIRLLWSFDIKPGVTADGDSSEIDIMNYTQCENMRPEAFKAQFIPRTEAIRAMVEEEAIAARHRLRAYDGETKHVPVFG